MPTVNETTLLVMSLFSTRLDKGTFKYAINKKSNLTTQQITEMTEWNNLENELIFLFLYYRNAGLL